MLILIVSNSSIRLTNEITIQFFSDFPLFRRSYHNYECYTNVLHRGVYFTYTPVIHNAVKRYLYTGYTLLYTR